MASELTLVAPDDLPSRSTYLVTKPAKAVNPGVKARPGSVEVVYASKDRPTGPRCVMFAAAGHDQWVTDGDARGDRPKKGDILPGHWLTAHARTVEG